MINNRTSYAVSVDLVSNSRALYQVNWKISVNGINVFVPFNYRERPFNTAKNYKVYRNGCAVMQYKGDLFSVWIKKNNWLLQSLQTIITTGYDAIMSVAKNIYEKIQSLDWSI